MEDKIEPITTDEQIASLAALAEEIWNQHFVKIVGQSQVNYMLDKFQSSKNIKSQIASGYEYYQALIDDQPIGYIGIIPSEPPGKMMLSKIYVKSCYRGAGVGSRLFEFTKKRAMETGAKFVWLTVNRNNTHPIEWYRKRGFVVTGEVKKDIGSGFYMDDYILEYELS